jgi:hypothetical protein
MLDLASVHARRFPVWKGPEKAKHSEHRKISSKKHTRNSPRCRTTHRINLGSTARNCKVVVWMPALGLRRAVASFSKLPLLPRKRIQCASIMALARTEAPPIKAAPNTTTHPYAGDRPRHRTGGCRSGREENSWKPGPVGIPSVRDFMLGAGKHSSVRKLKNKPTVFGRMARK